MTVPATTQRLDYLDAVRAFALLLGIVFHASLSFFPVFIGWAVMDISTSPVITSFVLVSHSFRMELFFLMAGFFSHMTFHIKGAGSFIQSRFMRILIPFVVGWFILRPLIVSAWIMGGESMRGEANVINGLLGGLQSMGSFPKEILVGTHLWFLYYLLMITAIALALRALLSASPVIKAKVTGWTDLTVAWIAQSRFSWLALSVPTAACLWFMSTWGMDTPDKSLVPHVPVTIVYGGFFGLGWLLHRQEGLIEQFARLSASRIAICIISIVVTIALSAYQTDMGHPRIASIKAAFVISYALMMWSLVSVVIGLFKHFFDKPGKTVRYIADASYWLYLIHLPVVIWLQIAFAELPWHWSIKLVSVSVLTVGISLVIYDLLVRSTVIGKILNGRKKERVLFRLESMPVPGILKSRS